MFATFNLDVKGVLNVIKSLPSEWWKPLFNDISYVLGMKITNCDATVTEMSQQFAVNWLRGQLKVVNWRNFLLTNIMYSQGMLTFNIPLTAKMDSFYQIRIEAVGGFVTTISYVHPGWEKWMGQIAANLMYKYDMGELMVKLDEAWIPIKIWNAICGLQATEIPRIAGISGILNDMIQDGEV
jgi:hypothetical protein